MALGCRVTGDHRSVTVLLWASQAGAVLADVRATGAIAAVFSQPSTHRTVQLKGRDAKIVPATEGDVAIVARMIDRLADDLGCLGYKQDLIRTHLHGEPGELAAIAFTPSSAFEQTPGPRAGKPLGS